MLLPLCLSLLWESLVDTWNRHTLDRVARAVVSGQRGYGEQLDHLADRVAELLHSRLEAVGVPGAKAVRCSSDDSRPEPQLLTALLARVEKHLAWQALTAGTHGCAQPR